tara:strand:- start:859 stop:1110 length:252 start_codon:yes stop_codon:yes gene_type:complete
MNENEIRLEIVKLASDILCKKYDYTAHLLKAMSVEQRENYCRLRDVDTDFPTFPNMSHIKTASEKIERYVFKGTMWTGASPKT